MDINEIGDEDLAEQANLVAELNLLKQTSSSLLDTNQKRQTKLKSNVSVDRFMDPDTVLAARKSVTKQVSDDIESGKVTGNLERYKSKQQFNAIKDIDRQNEASSPKSIARR